MAWRTIGYRIEKCYIPTIDGSTLTERFFLDAVQVDDKSGRKSSTNIINGTEEYCLTYLGKILPIVETAKLAKTNREIESEISEEDRHFE